MKARTSLLLVAAVAALSACGGGGSGGNGGVGMPGGNANEVPVSATASSQTFTAYLLGLLPSDSAEPLSLDRFDEAPVSDNAEPVTVN